MLSEDLLSPVQAIGPFEKAKTNLDKFCWNFMIFYTATTIAKAFEMEMDDSVNSKVTAATAELTLRALSQLVLDRDNGVWN